MPRCLMLSRARLGVFLSLCLALACVATTAPIASAASSQQVVDRIVVRIEDDIITLSEMHELAGYQQLVEGKSEPNDQLISELIEQWVVDTEATSAEFPPAAESEVDREIAGIESHFAASQGASAQSPPPAYTQRLKELALTQGRRSTHGGAGNFPGALSRLKFRPSVQVEDSAIETYYRDEFVPAMAAKKQKAPPLDTVREDIRELLVQRGISERAASWFDETKSALEY